MAEATQFCIALDNKPGMLAKICSALSRAKVNIEAISVADNADCCWVRLVASPVAAAKKALTKGRFDFCTQKVLTAHVANKTGELGRIAARMARAKVNVNYVYASAGDGESTLVVMGVRNIDRAAKALDRR